MTAVENRRKRDDDDRLPSPKRHKSAPASPSPALKPRLHNPSPPPSLSPTASPITLRSPPAPRFHQSTVDGDDDNSPVSNPNDDHDTFSDSDDELLTTPPPPHSNPQSTPASRPYNSFLSGCRSVFTTYTRLDTIDSGTYGTVHRALCNTTGRTVALKKIRLEEVGGFPITALREINILQSVKHAHIVRVVEVVVGRSHDSVYVVMEYAESDVKRLLGSHRSLFTLPFIKRLTHQLLTAVHHLHSRFLLHRDIKTSNLLYSNSPTPHLLLADFGLARPYSNPSGQLTPTVVTLWYRAPELLFGQTQYGPEIDVWSCGCVLAELLLGRPLLAGRGDMEQVGRIIEVLGSPSTAAWEELRQLEGVKGWRVKEQPGRLQEVLSSGGVVLTSAGWDVLYSMLEWRPSSRRSAKELLSMAWWDEEPRMENQSRMPKIAPANETTNQQ